MSQWQSIVEIAELVNTGKLSATELVEKSLSTIEAQKEFNVVIATLPEIARKRAKKIDEMIANGKNAGRLAGVPFIAKDNLLTFGADTTAASNILRGFDAPYQATVIERVEAEGAICVAKANLDAFGHGSSTENSDYMVTRNPHNKEYVPGGSSGGPAASVILDMAPFALATDTGGSIRQPAAFCGAIGLKPTYGVVSRNGAIAMASSTDVIGPMTRTVDDAAVVLDIISGRDIFDSTTIERDTEAYTNLDTELSGKTIATIKECQSDAIDDGVQERVNAAIEILKSKGAVIKEISLPSLPLSLACYYIICPAEISSNLSRYDGQRFGFSDKSAKTLDESFLLSRSKGFGREAKRRIIIGTYVLSSGYYDAYYRQGQKLRTKIIDEFEEAFKECDFLLCPTAPTVAFKVGANTNDPLKMYLNDIFTVGPSMAGLPAISIPVGESEGLPVGMQIIAPQKRDRNLLGVAKAIEAAL